jgi:hypothetical protein
VLARDGGAASLGRARHRARSASFAAAAVAGSRPASSWRSEFPVEPFGARSVLAVWCERLHSVVDAKISIGHGPMARARYRKHGTHGGSGAHDVCGMDRELPATRGCA